MHFESELIILDEPTNNLGVEETQSVLRFVRSARDSGHSCIFIAHNIYHVFQVVDRIIVLRRGKKVADNIDPKQTTIHCELQAAYQDYLRMTNSLADASTCDAIEAALPRLSSAIDWLDDYLNHLGANAQARAAWRRLEKFLRSAGGLDGASAKSEVKAERERSIRPFRVQRNAGRDATVERVWDDIKPPQEDIADHLVYMLGIRLSEINVAEGLAVVLCETPGMPWEFYHDLSRHLWDEVRHSHDG